MLAQDVPWRRSQGRSRPRAAASAGLSPGGFRLVVNTGALIAKVDPKPEPKVEPPAPTPVVSTPAAPVEVSLPPPVIEVSMTPAAVEVSVPPPPIDRHEEAPIRLSDKGTILSAAPVPVLHRAVLHRAALHHSPTLTTVRPVTLPSM